MMWRGTLISMFLHGSIMGVLFAGLPMLPDIFKRKSGALDDSSGHSISVEIVSADAVDRRQDVIAPDTTRSTQAPQVTTTGKLPALVVGPSGVTPFPEAARPEDGAAAKTRIPEGSLARPESRQTGQSRSSALLQRLAERTRQAQQAAQTAPPRGDAQAGGQPLAPDTAARSPAAASAPTTPPAPERTTAKTGAPARTATVAQAVPETGAVLPAAGENIHVQNSDFVQAVTGRKRDLVVQMLSSDKRLRQATTPRADAGTVPEQTRRKTLARLNKAARAGYPHAQFNLAGKYIRGDDVPKDPGEAFKLLTRAAQQGFAPAQSLLGLMRFTGFGVPQDQAESAFWWSLAADAGDDGAKTGSALLKNLLKPSELVQSRRLRARWGSLINDLTDIPAGNTNRRDMNDALRDASEQGEIDAVLSLLARGADADKAGEEGRNAVIGAAWRGRSQVIQLLLDRGVETELPDSEGRTPLIWAAINGHANVVARLLESGANPDRPDSNGGTALIRAAWNGHVAVLRSLIDAGADLNAQDRNGLTALAHATREGNRAIIQTLRDAGAR